jgi:hypothetical protein
MLFCSTAGNCDSCHRGIPPRHPTLIAPNVRRPLCRCLCRRFAVAVSGGPGSSAGLGVTRRGVYMRQPHEAAGPANFTVTVTPTLHEVRGGAGLTGVCCGYVQATADSPCVHACIRHAHVQCSWSARDVELDSCALAAGAPPG